MPKKWKDSKGNEGTIYLESELNHNIFVEKGDDMVKTKNNSKINQKLWNAINKLPLKEKDAILMYYFQPMDKKQLSQEKLARKLGIHPITFHRRLKSAKELLKNANIDF